MDLGSSSCSPSMSRKHQQIERGSAGMVIWDTGSSLYDSYELASLRRVLDRHLDGLPSSDEPPQMAGAPPPLAEGRSKKAVVLGPRRKVTLRALFRAVASWAVTRPGLRRRRRPRACACVGAAPASGGAVGSEV